MFTTVKIWDLILHGEIKMMSQVIVYIKWHLFHLNVIYHFINKLGATFLLEMIMN